MDCNPSCSAVRGIPQARILEWVAIPFSRDLPDPGIEPRSSALQAASLPSEPPNELPIIRKWKLKPQWDITSHLSECPSSKMSKNNKLLSRLWSKGSPCTLLVGIWIGTATVGNHMEAPQKLKIELPHYPATSLLGMYLKKTNKSKC